MAVVFSNNAVTTLAAGIDAAVTSVTVQDGSVFPALVGSNYTYVTFENPLGETEIVKVTAISGNTLTVVRAQDNTTARVFSSGSKCELRLTAALLNEVAAQADTDTVYTHPANHAISVITGLQTALDGKVDDSQVLTNVPANAVFTDTVYTLPPGYATETYVGTAISNLVDSSPATLDTLNELAAALGDDPNFATTVTNSIATKLPLAGGTVSGTLTFGSGSGFDLATFDIYGSMRVIRNNKSSSDGMYIGYLNSNSGVTRIFGGGQGSGGIYITGSGANDIKYNNSSSFWHAGNDGSGSGLDADLLDGQQGSYYAPASHNHSGVYLPIGGKAADSELLDGIDSTSFLRSDADDAFTGNLTTGANNHITFGPNSSWGSSLRIGGNGRTATGTEMASIATTDGNIHLDAASSTNGIYLNYYAGTNGTYFGSGTGAIVAKMFADGQLYKSSTAVNPYWNSTNDGSGSGLDADLLDGIDSGSFLRSDADDTASGQYTFSKVNDHAIRVGTIRGTVVNSQTGEYIQMYNRVNIGSPAGWGSRGAPTYGLSTYGGADLATDTGSVTISGNTAWHAGNDGSGSGLDADLLDGLQPSQLSVSYANSAGALAANTSPTVKVINFTGVGGDSGNGAQATGYGIYQQGGSWSPPFPDLCIAYHTGIKIGAHFNYNGTRFYNNSDWVTELFSVGNGDNNVRVIYNLYRGGNTVWDAGNDGSGSGLDADLLDGWHAGSIVKGSSGKGTTHIAFGSSANSDSGFYDVHNNGTPTATWYSMVNMEHYGGNHGHQIAGSFYSAGDLYNRNNSNTSFSAWARIWNTANDGSGSGLDADLLDGQQASAFMSSGGGGSPTFTDLYVNSWLRNNAANTGIYNQALGAHWYASASGQWNMGGGNTHQYLRMRTNHNSTVIGTMYANTSYQHGFLNTADGWKFFADNSNNFYCYGNITAYYSDTRLKDNQTQLTSGSGLALINQLKVKSFVWNNLTEDNPSIETGTTEIGLIAQEVEHLIPNAVVINEASNPSSAQIEQAEKEGLPVPEVPNYKTINYDKLIPFLVQSIQDLSSEIDQLKRQLTEK